MTQQAERLIITIDGPAGTGKSTVAQKLAKRLGLEFLDTGAMYRGLTAKMLDRGINVADPEWQPAVLHLARAHTVRFNWETDPPRLIVGERDVTERLRDNDVTQVVSDVAAMESVREIMVQRQREIGDVHPRLVTEGRDQGSIVFPNANMKFFLDASAQVRAQRRADQLREAGKKADLQLIRDQIILRDRKDSTRAVAPLICPEDATHIDTDQLTLDDVVDQLTETTQAKLGLNLSV